MKIRFSIILSFCWFISYNGVAQSINYFFIDDIYQRAYINPALNNKGRINVASGLGADFITNGPGIRDVIKENPNGGLTIDPSGALSAMNATNDIFGFASVNTIDISQETKYGRVSVGHAWKANAWIQYDKDLAELITKGNGSFIGQTLNVGPEINYMNYNEFYLGIQKKVGKIDLGIRIKTLTGIETVNTNRNDISLTTSDDIYQLTLETDYQIQTSEAFTYEDIENFNLDIQSFSFAQPFGDNVGFAIDFGAAVTLGDKTEISASIIDLGSILWDTNPTTYTSKRTQQFDGLDVSEFFGDDEIVVLDSIETLLVFDENTANFSTNLPIQMYFGATHRISDMWKVGAILQTIGNGERRANVLGINATAKFYDWLSVGALYSAKTGNAFNLGLNIVGHLGPVRGFISTDNIAEIGSITGSAANLRLGLSFRI